METKEKSQTKLITAHLLSGQTITQLEALNLYRCMRLASIINRLRKTYRIETIPVKDPHTCKNFAKYLYVCE